MFLAAKAQYERKLLYLCMCVCVSVSVCRSRSLCPVNSKLSRTSWEHDLVQTLILVHRPAGERAMPAA